MTTPSTASHAFEGVLEGTPDRPCTRCNLPDRNPVHAPYLALLRWEFRGDLYTENDHDRRHPHDVSGFVLAPTLAQAAALLGAGRFSVQGTPAVNFNPTYLALADVAEGHL